MQQLAIPATDEAAGRRVPRRDRSRRVGAGRQQRRSGPRPAAGSNAIGDSTAEHSGDNNFAVDSGMPGDRISGFRRIQFRCSSVAAEQHIDAAGRIGEGFG